MKKLSGNNFKLKEGDYVLFRKKQKGFEDFMKEFIGEVRDYDPLHSKIGVLKKGFILYKISGIITEYEVLKVFAWYKKGFIFLSEIPNFYERKKELIKNQHLELFKLSRKEILEFKGMIAKKEIIKNLKDDKK